jgi:hypothetical protein
MGWRLGSIEAQAKGGEENQREEERGRKRWRRGGRARMARKGIQEMNGDVGAKGARAVLAVLLFQS